MRGMGNESFIRKVREHFEFLIEEFGFTIASEEISDRFNVPTVTYHRGDVSLQITRGRGSLKVLIGHENRIKTSGTYGELLYFLEHGSLPSERVKGFAPEPDWELDHPARLLAQMKWYRDHLSAHLQSLLDLMLDPGSQAEFQKFADLMRERRQALKHFLRKNRNRNTE